MPFTFTADPSLTCGGTLTATIHLQDGATDMGNAVYTFTLGTLVTTTSFSENFDGVVAPALPAGLDDDRQRRRVAVGDVHDDALQRAQRRLRAGPEQRSASRS